MATFLTDEQEALAAEIGERLVARGERVGVAEATAGGLISAALLAVPGASRFYAGGAVVYTLKSRIALAGARPEEYEGYRGTTEQLLGSLAEALRNRLECAWVIAESGMAGPGTTRDGRPAGRTIIGVAGPVTRTKVVETGIDDRARNMVEFTTLSLRELRDAIRQA
ncbi:MAG: CinA family protein [Chloroflexi bacterium]|nr:CinA family protein [Chloroflexota bacterium]